MTLPTFHQDQGKQKQKSVMIDDKDLAVANIEPEGGGPIKRRLRVLGNIMLTMVGMLALGFILLMVFSSAYNYRLRHGESFKQWYKAQMQVEGRALDMHHDAEVNVAQNSSKIEVSGIGNFKHAIFLHDFTNHLTGILDVEQNTCLIKPMSKVLKPPHSFIDLLLKIKNHYFDVNATHVKEKYSMPQKPLTADQLSKLGSQLIERMCAKKNVYELEKKETCNEQAVHYSFHDTEKVHGTEITKC